MAMSVWMARTVPVSSAVLKIAERAPGDMGGYIFALPKWTPMLGFSSLPPFACSILFTGSLIFICEEVRVFLIGVLFAESHGEKNVLSKSNDIISYVVTEYVSLSQPSNAYNVILSVPNSPLVIVL